MRTFYIGNVGTLVSHGICIVGTAVFGQRQQIGIVRNQRSIVWKQLQRLRDKQILNSSTPVHQVPYSSMHNQLTGLLRIDVPVIGAPMAKASEADLCAAVAKAGGLGLIGAGYMDPAKLTQVYQASVQQLEGIDEVHRAVGVGLLNYSCSQELLQAAIELKPRAIWLSFGDWDSLAMPIKKAGIIIICQVQHLEQVEPALKAGADVIVGQSSESGGHGASPASLLSFIPELMDHVEKLCQKLSIQPTVPVVAAGGITDARQMAASFALGAAGVVLGTRLNATYESVYPEAKKQALVKAGSGASSHPSTIRTTLYDELSVMAWPPCVCSAVNAFYFL